MLRGQVKRLYDLQKASVWKRISAALFDLIMLVIASIGVALLLSSILNYDSLSVQLEGFYTRYETQYGVDFDITQEEYDALDEAGRANFDTAKRALLADAAVLLLYEQMLNDTVLIVAFSILAAYLILEFLIPLWLKNGQTLGKKIFSVAVMREDGVRLPPLALFVRTVLGKYTVETMIPVMVAILIMFGLMGPFGLAVLLMLLIMQIAVYAISPTRQLIHDKMARTVCVDMASQMIFETEAELIAYRQRRAAESAAKADY